MTALLKEHVELDASKRTALLIRTLRHLRQPAQCNYYHSVGIYVTALDERVNLVKNHIFIPNGVKGLFFNKVGSLYVFL